MTEHSVSTRDIQQGCATYTPFLLSLYNLYVVQFLNRWIWRCPKKYQLNQYMRYATDRHLDVGVGTGYYLKHNDWPSDTRLALMDISSYPLKSAARAVSHLSPVCYQVDVFEPQKELQEQFNSISINYLLHCLPGSMHSKAVVVGNMLLLLKPGGILFGATILADEHLHTLASLTLMNFYRRKGIFSNRYDTQLALQDILQKHLVNVEIRVVGCVALFKGQKPS